MPVKIPEGLPAEKLLETEGIFIMSEYRARHQDIRPLQIAILNLMPSKIETETQILRLLGNSPLQIEVTFLYLETHISRNTSREHFDAFYKAFIDIKKRRFDGLIITGAPVENLDFEDVDYWDELRELLLWSNTNVYSTLHICWGAQAGLFTHYGIPKHPLPEKRFGIFRHEILDHLEPIIRGFDDDFPAPHSRHTETRKEDVQAVSDVKLIVHSPEAGVYLVVSNDKRKVFVTGHPEYDRGTLKAEYLRDKAKGLPIAIPHSYFPDDEPNRAPKTSWAANANLLYANWLNYYVYQKTPFSLEKLPASETAKQA